MAGIVLDPTDRRLRENAHLRRPARYKSCPTCYVTRLRSDHKCTDAKFRALFPNRPAFNRSRYIEMYGKEPS